MYRLIVGVLLLITLSSSVPLEKWHKSEDGSKYFIDSENKYNWFEAWNECARKKMSLIAIDTFSKHKEIDTLIKKIFPKNPSFWLAGHDLAVDRRYEWATTGEVFSFSNWGSGQPDRIGNAEHCIAISQTTWQWYDFPCANKLGFICEENQLIKQKSQELKELRKTCDSHQNYKNVIYHIHNRDMPFTS